MKKTIMPHSDEQRVVGNLHVLEEWMVTILIHICSSREISNPWTLISTFTFTWIKLAPTTFFLWSHQSTLLKRGRNKWINITRLTGTNFQKLKHTRDQKKNKYEKGKSKIRNTRSHNLLSRKKKKKNTFRLLT